MMLECKIKCNNLAYQYILFIVKYYEYYTGERMICMHANLLSTLYVLCIHIKEIWPKNEFFLYV